VLFCGEHFRSGFELTAKELASDPGVSVECCPAEAVPERLADADMVVSTTRPTAAQR
jgi:hypothetical protein